MAAKRRVNWISQQRVDVPDMRAVESAVSNDFDELIKSFVTGTSQGYFLRGFEISMAGAIGGAASGLQMIVDPGAIFHINSSQSGTFFLVTPGMPAQVLNAATNIIVDGAFSPNAINYVGIEYERFIDDTTSAQIYIWNPTTNNETTKNAPRAQILRFRIKITTTSWATNVLPVCTVTTDSGNNVTKITDARYDLFRLGTGGASPNPFYVYPWTAQAEGRVENPSSSSSNSINPFHGGDKMIGTLKDWMNAVMSALLEIKGTTYWYSFGSAGSLASLREDLGNTVTTGKGTITHSALTAGLINWSDDIFLKVIGSNLAYKFLANPSSAYITLADNQVAYINLTRGTNILPNLVFTNIAGPAGKIVQSVGAVSWTTGVLPGDWIKLGSETDAGYYQIYSVDTLSQVTLTTNFAGTSTGLSGTQANFAIGSYYASPTPVGDPRAIQIADRAAVPAGMNIFWFLFRSDNLGIVPRVYVRFIGQELEQGDTEEVDDGVPRQLLTYIGSPLESASKPQYVSALYPGSIAQITNLTFGLTDAGVTTIGTSQYFYIGSSNNARKYYVWFKKDGVGADPMPAADRTGIQINITTGETNAAVAASVAAALSGLGFPDFLAVTLVTPNQRTVRVTNTSAGTSTLASNINIAATFTVTNFQTGTGLGNNIINDGDSLTLAIKRLDEAIGIILANANNPNYDEPLTLISGAPANTNQMTGPVLSGALLTLPDNSRASELPQFYTVGKGALQVFLNGQYLNLNETASISGAFISYGMSGGETSYYNLVTAAGQYAIQYTPASNVSLTDVKFRLVASVAFGCVGNLFSTVESDSLGQPSNTILGTSVNVAANTVGGTAQVVDFNYTTPVALIAGTPYWFIITGDSTSLAGANSVSVHGPTVFALPDPISFFNGTVWASLASTISFELAGTGVGGAFDWTEVGTANTFSNQIQINRNLVIGDIITFRIGNGGGSGGAGGGAGPVGPAGPPGANAAGGPIAISTKTSSYTVLLTDCLLKADCSGGPVTFTLPTAASAAGFIFYFTKIDSTSNLMTLAANGAELIDGLTTQTTGIQWTSFSAISDGSTWTIF